MSMTEERNVYVKNVREDLVEDDEISPEEEGFMKGYDEDYEAEDPDESDESDDDMDD